MTLKRQPQPAQPACPGSRAGHVGRGEGVFSLKNTDLDLNPPPSGELLTRRAPWPGWPLHPATGSFKRELGDHRTGKAPPTLGGGGVSEVCPGPRQTWAPRALFVGRGWGGLCVGRETGARGATGQATPCLGSRPPARVWARGGRVTGQPPKVGACLVLAVTYGASKPHRGLES